MDEFNQGDSILSSEFREKLNDLVRQAFRPIRGPGVEDNAGFVSIRTPSQDVLPPVGTVGTIFAVLVGTDGGNPGGSTSNCDFTYNVTDLSGVFLAGTQTPERARVSSVTYLPAGEGGRSDIGIAMYGTASEFKLLQCFGEIMDATNECPA